MEERKFKEEYFSEDELMLLKMAFRLVDTVVETQRTSNYDVNLCNELYSLKEKLGLDGVV